MELAIYCSFQKIRGTSEPGSWNGNALTPALHNVSGRRATTSFSGTTSKKRYKEDGHWLCYVENLVILRVESSGDIERYTIKWGGCTVFICPQSCSSHCAISPL